MRVVVLGAGVLGAATALALARAGAEVTLVEPDRPGGGTSSRGAGLVGEGMWHPTSLALVQRSVDLLAALSRTGEETGHPFRFHQVGSTTLLSESAEASGRALAQAQARRGASVRILSPHDAAGLPRHEGMRLDDVALCLHYPRDGWASPRLYSEMATLIAQSLGARLLSAPARLVRRDGRVEAEAFGERLAADAVVVAAGVHTRALLRTAGLDAPLLAYRTQALRYEEPHAEHAPILHDAVQGFYLRPGLPHHLVAGNGTTTTPEDPLRWNAEADAWFVEKTLQRLRHRFPALPVPAATSAWAGIDAATPDRLLLAGPHPDAPGLWVLAGGNGHGFMRAPAAGESLAALVLGRRPPVDLAAFDPGRFGDAAGDAFEIREGYSLEGPSFM